MDKLKRVTFLGTSGVGKTTLSTLLKREGWYHYSGDYRIVTHYLAEEINNWLVELLASSPLLASLYARDAIYFSSKVSIENIAISSAYVGKLGRQGYTKEVFIYRQSLFRQAEIKAMFDVPAFIVRSQKQGYQYFINDAGGSVGEIDDPLLFRMLQSHTLLIYIQADEALQQELLKRAMQYPKPICYHPVFLQEMIAQYRQNHDGLTADEFDSDDFIRFVTPKMIAHRNARYQDIAKQYGVIIDAKEVWQIRDGQDFQALVQQALRQQRN